MRRARERELLSEKLKSIKTTIMDGVNSNSFGGGSQGAELPTKFINKVLEIPVVKFGFNTATGFYGRVKDFNTITHKSLELAESVTGAVVGRVTPLAQMGNSLAGNPLHKIDDFAAQGLQSLEDKVPVINKEPQVMVSDVRGAVSEKLAGAKDRLTKASEGVLVSRPVQTYFDLLEFILGTAGNTLDKVLPPEDNEADQRSGPGETRRAERGWYLLGKFFGLLGTAKNRFVSKVSHRLDTTSNAAENVFKEAKKAVNNALPVDKVLDATNGDSKKGKKRSKNAESNN